jgi:hypothetical protein
MQTSTQIKIHFSSGFFKIQNFEKRKNFERLFFINHPKCMLILIKSLIKGQPRKFILQKGYRSNTLEKGNSTVPIFIETEQVCMR